MSNNPASIVTTNGSNNSSANRGSNPQNLRPIIGTPLNPPPQVIRFKNLSTPPPTRLPSSSPTRQNKNTVIDRKPPRNPTKYAFNPNNLVKKLKQLTTSQNSLSNEPINISSGNGTRTMNTASSSGVKTPSTIPKNSSAPSSGTHGAIYSKLNGLNLKGKNLNFNSLVSATSIEELIKDDTAFTKAIADLIAYTPDADGWSDVKFLVQVDTEKEMKERFYNLMGGVRESPEEYVLRERIKREDYVYKTYQSALASLRAYRIDRDTFELSKTNTQCKLAGIDRKTTEIPCWMCGYGTNLFKNATYQHKEGDVLLTMCDPKKNQFECEHILPAALMAFLEYLANTTYPVTDGAMMKSLYAGSCSMCNKIKSDNLYIKNTNNDGTSDFVPDDDELMKDVVAFFSAIHGTKKSTPCIDGEASIKKEDEDYYYTSVVTVKKEGLANRRYPNLIWAMLHKDLSPPITRSAPSPRRRKTEENAVTIEYNELESVFNNLINSTDFKVILDRDLSIIPNTIQKRIHVNSSVEWIKTRFINMREKIQGICSLLNTRKTHWNEKYLNVVREIPNFIKRIIYEAQEDIPFIETIIEDNTRQLQANTRNERAKRRKEMAEQMLAKDKEIGKVRVADDADARRRAKTHAKERIDDELNTFEEMRARNQSEERGAFPRRGSLNAIRRASAVPALPICNNKNKNKNKQGCSVQGGRYKSSTRKNRKSPKKNTRRK